jgi:predicted porin
MNKKLLAVAVAAFVAAPAISTADTTLFGQFKYEVGAIEDGEDRNAVHSYLGTRIGIMGSEDLGGGTKAIFRFQATPDNGGKVNRPLGGASWTFDEENWAGLQGNFGTLQLGRSDTAFKKGQLPFRAFADSLADLTTRPASWGRAEGVHYSSPNFSGFTVNATIEPNGSEFDSYWALGATYRNGPLFLSAAAEGAQDTGLYQAGGKLVVPDETNWQVGGHYKWGDLGVGVLYQDIGEVAKWATVPLTYTINNNWSVRATAQYRDPEVGSDGWNLGLGGSYNFSKRTELFAHVWQDNEDGGGPVTPGAKGARDETQFGIGLRHSF